MARAMHIILTLSRSGTECRQCRKQNLGIRSAAAGTKIVRSSKFAALIFGFYKFSFD